MPDRLDYRLGLAVQLAALIDAHEQVAQMRDEPADTDIVLAERNIVSLLDDDKHLLDDARHGIGIRQIPIGKARIDQMQRERHRLAAGQDIMQTVIER